MDARTLKDFLEQVKAGDVSVDEATRRLVEMPLQQVGDFAVNGQRRHVPNGSHNGHLTRKTFPQTHARTDR